MPIIKYEATNFPKAMGTKLVGTHKIQVSWSELVWAAISVGRANLIHILQHGAFSQFEIIYRAAILFANLREDLQGNLRRSAAYEGLDPSEKGAISYFLGLAVTKLLADKLMNTPWLMHLDVYRALVKPIFSGAGRPDLVGQNSAGDWVVFESKGRTNGFDPQVLQRAKQQAMQIATIGGATPILRVGAVTHFGMGALAVKISDPPSSSKEAINIQLNRKQLNDGYYRPFREWLSSGTESRRIRSGDKDYRVKSLVSADIEVGIIESLTEGVPADVPSIQRETSTVIGNTFHGKDGLLVRVGSLWSQGNMRLQPQERVGGN